ncbi:ribonuclease Z [Bradyrhizobium sp. AZCC 1610]|uniref:ribonuclease Z n=1 Tax=Bradyrhizobium sp. AZCC 1610 TaxID=3117020 RepID=UPI002FF2E60B
MRPSLHPSLVNGRSGDPALYIETLFERRAILFDLGDVSVLPPRKLLRLEYVFVSHAHVDHFIGFDHLLRLLIGRDTTVRLYGPEGFVDQVHHKLQAYRWNLVDRFENDLVFLVTELDSSLRTNTARFRLKNGFAAEAVSEGRKFSNMLCDQPAFHVSTAMLEHGTPCLAFAIEEAAHVNVWKSRLKELGLPVGPWLRDFKRAVIEQRPDDERVRIDAGHTMRLGEIRSAVTVIPGQKIGYVTDVAAANREAIIELVRNADLLFIEAPFASSDTALAAERAHLTTTAAGEIARRAGARRVEPFHFSSRYSGEEARLLDEVQAAFGQGP